MAAPLVLVLCWGPWAVAYQAQAPRAHVQNIIIAGLPAGKRGVNKCILSTNKQQKN